MRSRGAGRRRRAAWVAAGAALVAAVSLAGHPARPERDPLRVCADPNNLPFSNARGEGFENRLAELLARHVGTRVAYTWWPQRRGFIRNTLDAGLCDVVMGVPARFESVLTTQPYYRSTYVFVTRTTLRPPLRSLDDERLRELRIGVQMIGDDFANSPPAHALAARGLTRNVVGYSVLGDYAQPHPPSRIIDAVARGDVDVALAWGPLAGYFAKRATPALEVVALTPEGDGPSRPFAFDIAIGVRRGDRERQRLADDFIARRRGEIDKVLREFGVPRAARSEPKGGS